MRFEIWRITCYCCHRRKMTRKCTKILFCTFSAADQKGNFASAINHLFTVATYLSFITLFLAVIYDRECS